MKKFRIVALTFIIVYALILRFFKLDQFPPSLAWDEVAAGYNAYTIAHWGADEYGTKLPITFKSFGDDKHPVHIYLTAPIVGIFGLNDFATRSSSAAMGVIGVVAIYFLAKKLLKSEVAALFSALFLTVSPYHLQFSRGLWEANFALTFLILGLALFFYGIEKKNWLFPASVFSFGMSFFSYHSAKIVVPPLVLLLFILHFKKVVANKKILIVGILIALFFGALVVKDTRILGFARIEQNRFSDEEISKGGGKFKIYLENYKKHFSYSYLFEKGDQNPRHSVQTIGEFYKVDLVLASLGVIALLVGKNFQALSLILLWLILSPLPGALSSFEPNAVRVFNMVAPILLLSGSGAAFIIKLIKIKWIQILAAIVILGFLGREVYGYLKYYYTEYFKIHAIQWQYGMKQSVGYLRDNPTYIQAYVDNIRQQPYIFYLYYLKVPLPDLLATVKYETTQDKSFSTVRSFGKYQFGGWDIIESYPNKRVLYVVTPSYYTGLRHKDSFDIKALVKYPDDRDAFYIVGAPD